jgi:hypothetical protein
MHLRHRSNKLRRRLSRVRIRRINLTCHHSSNSRRLRKHKASRASLVEIRVTFTGERTKVQRLLYGIAAAEIWEGQELYISYCSMYTHNVKFVRHHHM